MQSSESEGTTSKGKEGSRGKTDKIGESGGIIQPPTVPSEEGTQADKKEWILQESREKSQKPGNNGHKNGKSTQKPGKSQQKSNPDFDPRDEIYGMENKNDQMACMRTRNSYFPNNSSATIPRRRNKRRISNVVEPELCTIVEMTDNRTIEELLQAPTEGYGEAIVITEINADYFEIKTNLLQLVQANPYNCFERKNPHTHINNFKRITSTLKFRDVPNDDLVNKFMNQSFPPSKTTHLKNEISRFTQRFEETFGEACERFKEILRACPHHGFTELAQIDTFYNGLNDNDQDSLNVAAGGNLLSKTTREALQIIKNKSKVRYSRNKQNISRMNTTSRDNSSKSDDRINKLADQILTLVDIFAKKIVTPASVKAVEESCVTCGGNHAYYNCPNTDSNQPSVCVTTGTYNQVALQNRASNYMAPPGFAPVQNGQNRIFKNGIQNTMKTQQIVLMEQQNAFQNNLQNMLSGFFQNQSSTSGTLSSNTIANPKGEMKEITTRSGVAYEGPSIPTPKKVVEQETEETTDKEKSKFQATNQMEKLFQIFQDLHFEISFVDALLLMPKFASTIKSLLTNKDKLFEFAKIPLNKNCSAMLLKKLPKMLRDPGKFLIPCDCLGMDCNLPGSGISFLLVVAFFFRQWEVPSGSGNFLTSSGNALCILFPTILL
nr:hypothetical protein [Tanacetum cinerariifolium]